MTDPSKLPPDLREWFLSRPKAIRDLIAHYPPGTYRIGAGAPYGISAPGTIVRVISYTEDEVRVAIIKGTPAGQNHLDALRAKYRRGPITPEECSVFVEPAWLHLLEVDKDWRPAWMAPVDPSRN